eukprot:2644405-Amphidinium_carterae.1
MERARPADPRPHRRHRHPLLQPPLVQWRSHEDASATHHPAQLRMNPRVNLLPLSLSPALCHSSTPHLRLRPLSPTTPQMSPLSPQLPSARSTQVLGLPTEPQNLQQVASCGGTKMYS